MLLQALWAGLLAPTLLQTVQGQGSGPFINLINQCDYEVLVNVGSVNGTLYQNEYELSTPQQTNDGQNFQTLTLEGSWPTGLAYATRVNGTVATQVHLDIPVGQSSDTFYISLESGYSVPAEVEPYAITGTPTAGLTCCPRFCTMPNVTATCTAPNLLSSHDAEAACQNVAGQGNMATQGTQVFKTACPIASTFNGDRSVPAGSQPVLGSCGRGTNYNIRFCPPGPSACQGSSANGPSPAPAPAAVSSQGSPEKGSGSDSAGAIAGGVVGGVVGASVIMLVAYLIIRRQHRQDDRSDQHLMPSVISNPWDQATGGKKPAWYQKLLPFSRRSTSRMSTSSVTNPTESGTSRTLDSSQSSLQLTGSKGTILSSTLRTHVPMSVNRKYFPSLPPKASIPFDELGIERMGQEDIRSQLGATTIPEEWELPKDEGLEKLWMIDSKQLQVALDETGQPVLLGKGAYGAVFKGTLGVRTVAIKVIHNNSAKEQARFVREIATLRVLHDKNVVMFLGACLQRNKTLLVMEYLPNGNLWDAIRADTHGQLRWYGRGRQIALDVAAGMAYLHSKRIVHLDLKTPNILLDEHLVARVADIGLGKTLAGVDVKASSATFLWAAPEQLQALPCNEAADVFSFGVVLWEICSGEAPLQRSMRPIRVPNECPQCVASLITRCISTEPAARPTMEEIFTILEASPVQH